MRNFKINTTLGVCPAKNLGNKKASYFITRGATGNLTFDLLSKAYTFDQIEQAIFVLREADVEHTVLQFKLYATEPTDGTEGILDSHFTHVKGFGYEYLNLELTSEETAALAVTDKNHLMEFEVVVQIDGDDKNPELRLMHTMIEKQPFVGVIDSIYGSVVGE